jgi:hypothetical protein
MIDLGSEGFPPGAVLTCVSQGFVDTQLLIEVFKAVVVGKGGILGNKHLDILDRVYYRAFHFEKLAQGIALLNEFAHSQSELREALA